jgi:hypothetical protein
MTLTLGSNSHDSYPDVSRLPSPVFGLRSSVLNFVSKTSFSRLPIAIGMSPVSRLRSSVLNFVSKTSFSRLPIAIGTS